MKKVLVTGGAGFLGRYLVRALLARGDRVRVFDLRVPQEAEQQAEWRTGDVRDARAFRSAVEGMNIIFHLAALIPQRKADTETMRAVNVGGTLNVLNSAQAAGVQRVVYLSSVEVFGVPSVVPCPEEGTFAPLGEYGRNKIASEALCHQAAAQGLEVVILRPPTIVGPGLDEPFLVDLLRAVRSGKPVMILGNGQNHFQFVHAQDVAIACLLASDHPAAAGQTFHIGSDRVPSIRQMVEEVVKQVGSASTLRPIPVPLAHLAIALLQPFGKAPLQPEHVAITTADYVFDIRKAKRVLAWEPHWGNVDAMVDTYQHSLA